MNKKQTTVTIITSTLAVIMAVAPVTLDSESIAVFAHGGWNWGGIIIITMAGMVMAGVMALEVIINQTLHTKEYPKNKRSIKVHYMLLVIQQWFM